MHLQGCIDQLQIIRLIFGLIHCCKQACQHYFYTIHHGTLLSKVTLMQHLSCYHLYLTTFALTLILPLRLL